ncbi:hypothetical protein, partial [Mesorhizobium sp.]|uniref:hypothetical protein n=1 Tax=Mesorhizobium sp. TaxID=1871066 RepID=UPI00345AA405
RRDWRWQRLPGWRTGGGRRLPRSRGMIVVAGENLAPTPAFAALAALAFLLLGVARGMPAARPRMAIMMPPRGWARRIGRRSPGHAHFRRASAGVVVFHCRSFRHRANRERTQQALLLFQVAARLTAPRGITKSACGEFCRCRGCDGFAVE